MARILTAGLALALVLAAACGGDDSSDVFPTEGLLNPTTLGGGAQVTSGGSFETPVVQRAVVESPAVDGAHPTVEGTWPDWAAEGGPFPAATDEELAGWIRDVIEMLNGAWFTPHMWSGYAEAQIPVDVALGGKVVEMGDRPWYEGSPLMCGDTLNLVTNSYCRHTYTMDWQVEAFHARNRQAGWPYVFRSVAHEFGHHLQNVAGSQVSGADRELQAECLAGEMLVSYGSGYEQVYEIEERLLEAAGGATADDIPAAEYLRAFAAGADPSAEQWTGCFARYGWPPGAGVVAAPSTGGGVAEGSSDAGNAGDAGSGDVVITDIEVEGGDSGEDITGVRPAPPELGEVQAVAEHWYEYTELWSSDPEAAIVFMWERNAFECPIEAAYDYLDQMPPGYVEEYWPAEETVAYDDDWVIPNEHLLRFAPDRVYSLDVLVRTGTDGDMTEDVFPAHLAMYDGWTYHFVNFCGG